VHRLSENLETTWVELYLPGTEPLLVPFYLSRSLHTLTEKLGKEFTGNTAHTLKVNFKVENMHKDVICHVIHKKFNRGLMKKW